MSVIEEKTDDRRTGQRAPTPAGRVGQGSPAGRVRQYRPALRLGQGRLLGPLVAGHAAPASAVRVGQGRLLGLLVAGHAAPAPACRVGPGRLGPLGPSRGLVPRRLGGNVTELNLSQPTDLEPKPT